MIEIVDQSNNDLYSQNQDLINNFADYSSKNLDFDKPVKVYFMDDVENAKDPLGKTAYYDPDKMEIKIYITGRHLKDILRSISHELIHHVQNCRGDFGSLNQTSPGYAQEDDHLRGMEHEAYTMGNIMNFRDFEDNYKKPGANTMSEQKINKLRALVREGVKQVLSEQEGQNIPAVSSEQAQNKCIQMNFDGAKRLKSYPAPSPKGSGVFKCIKCPEGMKPGVAEKNSLNPLGCGFLNKTQKYEPGKYAALDIEPGARWWDATTEIPFTPDSEKQLASTSGQAKKKPRYRKCDKLPLRKGCQGDNVKEIQNLLGIKSDGKFGRKTKAAVIRFQKNNGLKADGVVGTNTLEQLRYNSTQKASGPAPAAAAPAPASAAAKPADVAAAPAAAQASTIGPAAPATAQASTRARADQLFKSLRGLTKGQLKDAYSAAINKSDEDPQIFNKIEQILTGIDKLGTKQFQQRVAQLRRLGGLPQLEESLTIEQKKLTEAKSLFERLKKVL